MTKWDFFVTRFFLCENISVQIAENFPLPLVKLLQLCFFTVYDTLGSASFLGPCSLTVRVDDRFAHVRLEQGQMVSTSARGTGIARTPWNTRKREIIVCPNYTEAGDPLHTAWQCDSMRNDVAMSRQGYSAFEWLRPVIIQKWNSTRECFTNSRDARRESHLVPRDRTKARGRRKEKREEETGVKKKRKKHRITLRCRVMEQTREKRER